MSIASSFTCKQIATLVEILKEHRESCRDQDCYDRVSAVIGEPPMRKKLGAVKRAPEPTRPATVPCGDVNPDSLSVCSLRHGHSGKHRGDMTSWQSSEGDAA